MKKRWVTALYIVLFLVITAVLNGWSQTANYTKAPLLMVGPQLKATNQKISERCIAMAIPSVYVYYGLPFSGLKPETPCDPVRVVYPVGIMLNTLVAAAMTVGVAYAIRSERKEIDDSHIQKEESHDEQ